MHYYRHHIGDFKRDTGMLNDHQCMTYLRLIWLYYDTESGLADEPEKLAFQVSSTPETVRLLLEHFFSLESGLWRHSRCDEEIAAYRARKKSASDAAKKRWNDADRMRSHSQRNADASKNDADARKIDANQEPITSNQEVRKENRGKTAARFSPPTPDQVRDYCRQRGNAVDAERFVDFYAAKGWMVGKNRMKDWKAAVRTWERGSNAEPVRKRKML